MSLTENNDKHMNQYSEECPVCGGTGMMFQKIKREDVYGDKDIDLEEVVPCTYCNGGHDNKVVAVKKDADIPYSFYSSRMSDFDWIVYKDDKGNTIDCQKLRNAVNDFINNFAEWEKENNGLYLWSSIKGTGKTLLASCICNELMKSRAMTTKFVSVSNLISIAKSADSESMDKYKRDPIALLCNCKLLVLDDVGQNTSAEKWVNDILFRILDARNTQKLMTIVTSNVPIGKLDMDTRITDRIYDLCMEVHLPEYCVRSHKAKERKRAFMASRGLI